VTETGAQVRSVYVWVCEGPGAGRGPLTLPHVTPAEVPDAVRGAFAGLPASAMRLPAGPAGQQQLGLVAGSSNRMDSDVVGEVEGGSVDPQRPAQP
jgi:hypothetical protein